MGAEAGHRPASLKFVTLLAVNRVEAEPARNELFHAKVNSICVEPVLCEQQALARVLYELVRESEPQQASVVQVILFKQFHHGAAESAVEVVVFDRDD